MPRYLHVGETFIKPGLESVQVPAGRCSWMLENW